MLLTLSQREQTTLPDTKSRRRVDIRAFEWRVQRKAQLEEDARNHRLQLEREERERRRQLEAGQN
jgi:hypothetical protein